MTGVDHYQHSGSKGINVKFCGQVPSYISIQVVQKPNFVTIGTTGIKERLMHDSDQYISIL